MAFKAARTKNGYNLFHVASAFQKSIRRGLEDEAFFWGYELYNSNFDNYAWKRLTYIVSEDIGLAEPSLPASFGHLKQSYEWHKKEFVKKGNDDGAGKLFFTHALLLCVRAKKSRICDDAFWHHDEEWSLVEAGAKEKPELPDYTFDKHTQEGRKMGRGMIHFYEESAKLEPHDRDLDRTEFYEDAVYELGEHMDANKGKRPSELAQKQRPAQERVRSSRRQRMNSEDDEAPDAQGTLEV